MSKLSKNRSETNTVVIFILSTNYFDLLGAVAEQLITALRVAGSISTWNKYLYEKLFIPGLGIWFWFLYVCKSTQDTDLKKKS